MIKPIVATAVLTVLVQPAAWAAEHWQATSTTATSITGNVTLASNKITFSTGKSLPLAAPVPLPGFSVEGQKVAATLYKVTAPADLQLVRGNRLCDGRPITYIVVWTPRPIGGDVAPRSMSPFSGPAVPTTDDSPTSCGTFNYEVARV
jgi:hypothetical protein